LEPPTGSPKLEAGLSLIKEVHRSDDLGTPATPPSWKAEVEKSWFEVWFKANPRKKLMSPYPKNELGMMIHNCNPSYLEEAEVGESNSKASPKQKCKIPHEK
jgi:hypothetical protein